MIGHIFHFYGHSFHYSWNRIFLPFRLIKGDIIESGLIDTGYLMYNAIETDEWIRFSVEHDLFEVDWVQINSMGNIEVWLKLEGEK